jgi:DNA polymerase-1
MIELTFPLQGEAVPVHVPESGADLDAFRDWFEDANRRGPIGFDTETTGLDIYAPGYRVRTAQFGDRTQGWVLRVDNDPRMMRHAIRALKEANKLIIHNAPFDWLVCDEHMPGITLEMLAPKTIDSRLLAALVDPRGRDEGGLGTALKPNSAHYLDPHAPDTQEGLYAVFHRYKANKHTGWKVPEIIHDPTFLSYGGGDVILVSRLAPILAARLSDMGVRQDLIDYEHELARICSIMTRTGILIDQDYTRNLDVELEAQFAKYSGVAASFGVINVNSNDQIITAMQATGVELTERTEKGALSVGKTVINPLAGFDVRGNRLDHIDPHPLAEAIYHAKRASKWRKTYVERFLNNADRQSRIHPSINSLQARTARMSITGDLAAQTLPSSDSMIRRAVLAEPGHRWFSVDFTAVELRVLAALADVRLMKQAIAEGRDLHDFTTELVYGNPFTPKQRKTCKGIGLGKVYGGGLATLVAQSGAPAPEVAKALKRYEAVYPEIGRASRRWQREARQNGFVTVTATGRPLPLDPHRAYAVVNYQCQSAARDVLGQGLITIEEAGLLPYLRLPIHDEVVGSAPADEAEEIMHEVERCMTMSLGGVPIDAKGEVGGRSWGSLYGADF